MKTICILLISIMLVGCNESDTLRVNTNCPIQTNQTAVIMAFGQSNSANFGTGYDKALEAFNLFNNECYPMEGSALGASGTGNTVWNKTANKILPYFDNVIFKTFGVGGTSINEWSDGEHSETLQKAIFDVKTSGVKPTHIIWLQGEKDAKLNTSTEDYYNNFLAIRERLRNNNILAPIYITLTSRCGVQGVSENIRNAQLKLINDFDDIYFLADTDKYGANYRYDECHFNEDGFEILSELFKDKLI